MTQTPAQRRASDQVAAWLARHHKNPAWLVDQTGADPGTIGDFINGKTWPKVGTQGKIESALGWPSGCIRQIGNGADPQQVGAVLSELEQADDHGADFLRIDDMGITEQEKAVLRATLTALLWPGGRPDSGIERPRRGAGS